MNQLLHDEHMERTVLGAILEDNTEFDGARSLIGAEDFYLESNRRIFRVVESLIQEGAEANIGTAAARLRELGQVEAVGGIAYVSDLTTGIPRKFKVRDYCERILKLSQLRQLAEVGEELTNISSVAGETAAESIERTRTRLEEILSLSAVEETLVSTYTIDTLDQWKRARRSTGGIGMPYGVPGLDERTGGMYPGENTTVGGAPGHGKTVLAMQAIEANCPQGRPVFFVSLEMRKDQILKRLWAREAGIAPIKIRQAQLSTDVDELRVSEAAMKIANWPLHIYDKSTVRLDQLTGLLRLAIRKHKVKLFIVDFVQIVAAGGRDLREQISRASDQLTAVAKGEGVHLMLLSQLTRKTGAEHNRAPRLSDLRESGALEQNAHCVVLIHRPWDEENGRLHTRPASENEPGCELIIAKQREGSTSAFPVNFNSHSLRFEG